MEPPQEPQMFDSAARPALALGVRLQKDRLTGESLLLSPEGIVVLNPTAQAIVERCDGRTTVEAMTEVLATEYEAEVSELRVDVLQCLRELHARHLVVAAP
jgi:coenzyme PQQ biosynthesis protein PqqD